MIQKSTHKNNIIALFIIVSITMTMSFMSCQKKDPMCYQPTEASMRIGFEQKILYNVDTFIDSILVDTTFIIFRDTLMPYLQAYYDDGTTAFSVIAGESVSSISLLLNPNESSTRYLLSYDSTSTEIDTLIINHENTPVFISNECGFTNFYNIKEVSISSSGLDSMHTRDGEVTLDNSNNKRHISFYFFNE